MEKSKKLEEYSKNTYLVCHTGGNLRTYLLCLISNQGSSHIKYCPAG